MMKTLLVIDMQVGFFEGQPPCYRAGQVLERINQLAAALRGAAGAVIFVQQDGPAGSKLDPDKPGWQLLPGLDIARGDLRLRKRTNDCFYATGLDDMLADLGSKDLIVADCATEFCVDTAVRAAASRDFRIEVAADAHTTRDRPHLGAAAIIRHHNWIWSRLITPAERVRVRSTRALRDHLS